MKIIWTSMITDEMVINLSDEHISQLIEVLDQSVQEICESFEVA
jgi:uncharacterized protein (DUF1778 family)